MHSSLQHYFGFSSFRPGQEEAIHSLLAGQHTLTVMVDDLFDSGATLEEITRLLLRQGAAHVAVFTLTRTIHADA